MNKIRTIFVLGFFCFVGASMQTQCMFKFFKEIIKKQKVKKEEFIKKTKEADKEVHFLTDINTFWPIEIYLKREYYLDVPDLYVDVKNFVKALNKKEKNNCFEQIKIKIKKQYDRMKKYKELKSETKNFKDKYLYDAKDFALDIKYGSLKRSNHDILECLSAVKGVLDYALVKIKKKKTLIDGDLIEKFVKNSVNMRFGIYYNVFFNQDFFPYYKCFGEPPISYYEEVCAYEMIKRIATNQDKETVKKWDVKIERKINLLKEDEMKKLRLKIFDTFKKSLYTDVAIKLDGSFCE